MAKADGEIELTLGWTNLGDAAHLRRNEVGLEGLKTLAVNAGADQPFKLNAFLYAFLCPAKNLDLFLTENTDAIASGVGEISDKMKVLDGFERDAMTQPDEALVSRYLALRRVIARTSARDEQRTLAALLFSGPGTAQQVADDLGISENLAARMLRALGPVLQETDGRFLICNDTDSLAVVLYLLRSTLGVDPITVLRRRVGAQAATGG